MNVVCGKCGAQYRVDPSRINGPKAWFKCRSCDEKIIVEPESPAAPPVLPADPPASWPAPDTDESNDWEDTVSEPSGRSHRLGLTAKVILLMLIVSLIPGSIFFTLSSKFSHDRIVSETTRTGMQAAAQMAGGVDDWIDKNARALKTLSNLPLVQAMDPAGQETVLKALQKEYPWIYLAFTTDTKGMNVARSDGAPLKDYSGRQYVQDIANGKKLAWQNLIGKTSKKPALVLAVPIVQEKQTVGVLAAAMMRDAISDQVTGVEFGTTGSGFLVDPSGKVVAHKNNAYVQNQQDMSTHPMVAAVRQGRTGGIEFTDADGNSVIGFAHETELGWIMAVQQDREEVLAPLKRARFSAIMLLAATLAIVLLTALFASRAIVRPISDLTRAANRISVGDLDVEISVRSKDEIGDLADAVTRLQDSIRISMSRLQRLRRN